LEGKLSSTESIRGVDLAKVVDARIDVQNPSFLLSALLERYQLLALPDLYDMKANLPSNIEFVFGPPGTGKTTHLAESMLLPLMRSRGDKHILVLAPTNKAADVLTTRILEKMGDDPGYKDWLVRFGTCSDERIEKAGVWRDRTFDLNKLTRSIVVTTVARYAYDGFSSDNGKLFERDWDYIVIDEASMIPIFSIVYPLFNCKPAKFVIAGDPFQIEPIMALEQWKDENIYTLVGLNRPGSFKSPKTEPHAFPITNLSTQYRSIPSIGKIFSLFTYDGVLKHHRDETSQQELLIDGITVKALNLIKFPVSKYESIYRAKRLASGTPYQTYSALFSFEFLRYLVGQLRKNHSGEKNFKIGLIAPYRAQANIINKLVDSWKDKPAKISVQVGTIHGFQGDECDIIISVFNPPPNISRSSQMFLNKQNILNVAISRARDYLFIIMPDKETDNVWNLFRLAEIEKYVRQSEAFSEHASCEVEHTLFGNKNFLEENTFVTGHQMVNVYERAEKCYEVRSDELSVDIQVKEKSY
jgi:AAA domain